MNISKLPKLSQTPAPPQGQATNDAPTQATMDYRAPSTPVATILSGWGPEAWISMGLGLILLGAVATLIRHREAVSHIAFTALTLLLVVVQSYLTRMA